MFGPPPKVKKDADKNKWTVEVQKLQVAFDWLGKILTGSVSGKSAKDQELKSTLTSLKRLKNNKNVDKRLGVSGDKAFTARVGRLMDAKLHFYVPPAVSLSRSLKPDLSKDVLENCKEIRSYCMAMPKTGKVDQETLCYQLAALQQAWIDLDGKRMVQLPQHWVQARV